MRVHQGKEQWGESSPGERAMGGKFTMRKKKKKKKTKNDGVRFHPDKERWGESSPR